MKADFLQLPETESIRLRLFAIIIKNQTYMDVLVDGKNRIDAKVLDEIIQENVRNNFIRTE